jgi:AcrR family transcriptional regulator
MGARAEALTETRRRIIAATVALGIDDLDLDPTLERVAARAEVSVQTVLRHFGNRDRLLAAATATALAQVADERVPGAADVDSALSVLIEHYERRGRFALRVLAREDLDPRAAEIAAGGKLLHRDWVESVFAARLPAAGAEREALTDLLVVATDVYSWKLLALDRGLDAGTVRSRMHRLVEALLTDRREPSCPPL